ncbi:hypothetical protein FCJ61_05905 [Burkholderia metallica]|uniref:hypothetical protein n=1 Tax=Burkholderia metallica TaxID=488729 RepID=UPI00157AD54C|nr:hypothetical protein [Burkholderia metallica]NTZ82547.1 hypothetical protein [Burkholderia metallica]
MTYATVDVALTIPVDHERIQKTASYYTDGKFFLEVYRHGTCVFPRVPKGGQAESGTPMLSSLFNRPIDFTVKEMDDRNFVVRFSDFAFAIVFRDEFERLQPLIERQLTAFAGDEVVFGVDGAPQEHLLVGVYARTRLLADLHAPVITKRISPEASTE